MEMSREQQKRAPNPPLGYSRECKLTEAKQIRLVAEFHANRIRPSRIAYRLGIDIALIEALLTGALYSIQGFSHLLWFTFF